MTGKRFILCLVLLLGVLAEENSVAMSRPPSIQWSADGSTVAIISDTSVQTFDQLGNPLRSVPMDALSHEATLSPDGAKVAYLLTGQQVWVLDLASGLKIQVFSPSSSTQSCVSIKWSSDGRNLTYLVMNFATPPQGQVYMVKPDGTGRVLLMTYNP